MPAISARRIAAPQLKTDFALHLKLPSGLTVTRGPSGDQASLSVPLSSLKVPGLSGKQLAQQLKGIRIGPPFTQKEVTLAPTIKNGRLTLEIPGVRAEALGNNPLRFELLTKNGHLGLVDVGVKHQSLDSTPMKRASVLQNLETMKRVIASDQEDLNDLRACLARGGAQSPAWAELPTDDDGRVAPYRLKIAIAQLETALVRDQKNLATLTRELKRIDSGKLRDIITGTFDRFE